jgi:hypothetical protein
MGSREKINVAFGLIALSGAAFASRLLPAERAAEAQPR